MAACELKRNHNTNYCAFYIDNTDDITLLPTSKKSGNGNLSLSAPCCIGSVARDMTGKQYTLNSNDEWVAFTIVSGSGGGSNVGDVDVDVATDGEVENMLDDVF